MATITCTPCGTEVTFGAAFLIEVDGGQPHTDERCAEVQSHEVMMYVACRQCGEVFDQNALTVALDHAGTCGSDQGFDVVTEDEAF
jgi:hypothetical protein